MRRRVFAQPPAVSPTLDPAATSMIGWAITPNAVDQPATALTVVEQLATLV
ncbi:MAG TPA: hypothetical protein VHS54_06655 [Jatrophihabitans sp.]|nr:hypothetical protein [Jatrophihabitans sp.]